MFTRIWPDGFADSSVGRPAFVAEHNLYSDQQAAAAEQIEAALAEVDLIRVVFCDPHGLARSKTLSPDAFRVAMRNGMDFSPGPFLFDTAHAIAVDFLDRDPDVPVHELVGAGDFVVVPDPLTFHVLPPPWTRTAWVIGDEYLRDGSRHPLSTRDVLRRVTARYTAESLIPVVGLEVEWYLTRLLAGPAGNVGNGFGQQGPPPQVAAVNPGYQFNSDAYSDATGYLTDDLARLLYGLGLPLRTIEHESGPGQLEFTFEPMRAAAAADAMLLFRTLVKQFCARRGHHASFMALPAIDGFDPSGWHIHQSVMDTAGHNIFRGAGDATSSRAGAYVGGLLAAAGQLCLLSVPTINGYRRLRPQFVLSPSRADVAYENRTAMVRIVGAGAAIHVENRIAEPCANPYLAMAAQLAAGLDGLTGGTGMAAGAEPLPQSLAEALTAFRRSRAAGDLLGPTLAGCLARLKDSELSRFEKWSADTGAVTDGVTEWEQREYFAAF
jgi:glutamine synthetase